MKGDLSELDLARLCLAAVCLLWGTTYLAIRIAVMDLPPALFSAARFLAAGGALFLYCLARGMALPRGREWLDLAAVSAMLLAFGNGVLAWAVQWVPTSVASLIVVSTPFWMVAFARASGEAVGRQALAGLALGYLGLALLLYPELRSARLGSGFVWGAAGLFLSSLVWAYGSNYSKRRASATDPFMTIAVQMLMGGAMLALVGLARGEAALWRPTAASWAAMAYLALFGSIIGYGSYIYALSKLPTAQVAIYAYVNPLVAILLGVRYLGERLDPLMKVGVPLVLAGVYLVNSAQGHALPKPEAEAHTAS